MDRINGPRTLEALCENIMNYTLSIQWNFHGQADEFASDHYNGYQTICTWFVWYWISPGSALGFSLEDDSALLKMLSLHRIISQDRFGFKHVSSLWKRFAYAPHIIHQFYLALPKSLWLLNQRQIISLWDIIFTLQYNLYGQRKKRWHILPHNTSASHPHNTTKAKTNKNQQDAD